MRKYFAPTALFLLSFGLYVATLAPGVVSVFDDSLELQLALPTFAIVHPTGYPTYTLLGWLFTRLIPFGDAAFRVNLFSALAAAMAVALLYLVARRLGSAAVPASTASLLLALSPVWWSQATIAEVYAAQGLIMLLILYALLRWDEAQAAGRKQRWLALTGLLLGLGLTHHRLTLLLFPAVLLFIVWGDPGLIRRPRAWIAPILAILAPLAFYALLPLRAGVGSLDGSYAQIGFWGWVLGGGFSTFLQENPFGIDRSIGDLLNLLVEQYGLLGILIVAPGYTLWLMQPRRFVLLTLIALADLIFAWQYLVLDIHVFLIPLFIVWAFLMAVGLTVLWDGVLIYLITLIRRTPFSLPRLLAPVLLGILFLAWPASLLLDRFPEQDRSQPASKIWRRYSNGLDSLQVADPDSTVVGLLGEMTLLRYFQRTEGIRPDVNTIAADADEERLAAIMELVEQGETTYTTHGIHGLAERFSLSSDGPLIRVRPDANTQPLQSAHLLEITLTPEVTLAGWDIELLEQRRGPTARLSILWRVGDVVPSDFKVSTRLLAADGGIVAQEDDTPVRGSYPPPLWRADEMVLDNYDLRLHGVPKQPLTLLIILYHPEHGSEIARWEQQDVHIRTSN